MRLLPALLLLLLLAPLAATAAPVASTRGIAATAHPAATQAAVDALAEGGSAADAAAAAAFVLAVVEPFSSGLGGGGFALVRHDGALTFLDFREVAPAAATPFMFLRDGVADPALSRDGALSVAVPGAVAGYVALHARFGRLPRARVLAPAIRLAKQGFPVDERFRGAVAFRLAVLRRDPEAARLFLTAEGEVPPPGAPIVQRELATTLEAIARSGAPGFYAGPVAERLAADLAARGGLVTRADLAAYRVRERAPLVGRYRDHLVVTAPLPSAGGAVVLTVLGFLQSLPPTTPHRDPARLHLYAEACRQAFADRALLGDPAFVPDPTSALLAPARLAALAAAVPARARASGSIVPGAGTTLAAPTPPAAAGSDHTTHLSVVDAEGNAVALTSTVNWSFGAGIVAKGAGVVWNDELDDFAAASGASNAFGLVGAGANLPAPGKIPLSSMAPTMVFDGPAPGAKLRLVLGSPGGPRIPTTIVQAIVAHLDHGADVRTALALPRLHHQHLPDRLSVEPFGLDPLTAAELRLRGHELLEQEPWSNATAIAIDPVTGLRTAAADPRGVGTALAEPSRADRK